MRLDRAVSPALYVCNATKVLGWACLWFEGGFCTDACYDRVTIPCFGCRGSTVPCFGCRGACTEELPTMVKTSFMFYDYVLRRPWEGSPLLFVSSYVGRGRKFFSSKVPRIYVYILDGEDV